MCKSVIKHQFWRLHFVLEKKKEEEVGIAVSFLASYSSAVYRHFGVL